MPTPPRTSIEAITAAGRALLEAQGPSGLTMQAVAIAVGVRPPSLYKHVADRDALVGLVADAAAAELSDHLSAIQPGHPGPEGALAALARSLRSWAAAHPDAYRLVFAGHGSAEAAVVTSGPVLAVARSLAGDENALAAARLMTAWATGFVSMELAGAFKLDGDVEVAFDYALDRLAAALGSPLTTG